MEENEEKKEFYDTRVGIKSLDETTILRKNLIPPQKEPRPKTAPPRKRKSSNRSWSIFFGGDTDEKVSEEDSDEAKALKTIMKGECTNFEEMAKVTKEFQRGGEIFEKIWRSPLKLISLNPIRNDQSEEDEKEAEPHLLVSKIHLAIIYNNSDLLKIIYDRMKDNWDFCDRVLRERIELEDGWNPGKKYKIPCELFELPTLHLTMKCNDGIFKRMLQIAKGHGDNRFEELMKLEDKRGFTVPHLAAFQRSMTSLK